MGSGHSKSANFTGNGSEGLKCLVDEKEDATEHGQKFHVFLSHSGKQKNFVRQLNRDLTNLGVSCFFDEDPQSLPLGKDFPPRIFEAAKTCRLAVLLLSKEFLESKWPMLEASTFVKARHTNPNLEILPLYFMIPPEALKQITANNEKWKGIEKSEERRAEWHQALNAIRRISGLKFGEGGNEVEFRDKIVKEICRRLLTQSRRYHVSCMQGEERMCQEVANFFNTVHPNEKGIRIAGLYGIAGHGKTTLAKATCNFKLADFEGKVCHLEFCQGGSFERLKLAMNYITHCPQSHLQTLTTEDQAQAELYKRVRGQRVLLILDNITDESIGEVTYYVQADFGENSCILLCARSVDVLVKHFKIDRQSCMRVPSLVEDEAIGILLGRISLGDVPLGAEDRSFVLKCAKRCSFKETSSGIAWRGRRFHPLALRAFGGHLFGKYGSSFQKWVAEIDGLVDRSGYGLDDVFAVLGKAFNDMHPKYSTLFMLLTVYMPPNMSPHNATEWLAINCNEEISFIEKAVEDLCEKAFIEEYIPGIRIHDLYIEFAHSKAKEMVRWLWWKGDQRSTRGLISQDNAGFELVKLEHCKYRSPSQIGVKYLQNLLALQLVGVQNMSKLDLAQMNTLRSITLHNCEDLSAIEGMENLFELAWLQISEVHPMFKLPELSRLQCLQHLEIDIAVNKVLNLLGDLTSCFFLREIKVHCPTLLEFPRLNGLPYLEKVEFSMCDKVKEPLDCTDCVELQSVVLDSCSQMVTPPLLAGCKKLSKIALSECDAVTACPDIDVPSALKTLELFISSKAAFAPRNLKFCYALENLQLWNMRKLEQLPGFRCLSNLTVLKLGKCSIREPPDLTCCVMLEDVCFFTLNFLERFPNFSSLRKLKNLSLYNCRRVQDPPDINGCHELQVFDLLYNDNLKGLPRMDCCPLLEHIKVSWNCEDEVVYDGIDPESWEVDDDDESWLEHFKDEIFHFREFPEPLRGWQWLTDKTMLAKKYFRGVKVYNSITAPYETSKRSKFYGQNSITLSLRDSKVVAFPTPGRDIEDPDWLNKVQEYFAGKEDIASTSSASDKDKHQVLKIEDLRNMDLLDDLRNMGSLRDLQFEMLSSLETLQFYNMTPPFRLSNLPNPFEWLRALRALEVLLRNYDAQLIPEAFPSIDSLDNLGNMDSLEDNLRFRLSNLARALRAIRNYQTAELIPYLGEQQDSTSNVVYPVSEETQPPNLFRNYETPQVSSEALRVQGMILLETLQLPSIQYLPIISNEEMLLIAKVEDPCKDRISNPKREGEKARRSTRKALNLGTNESSQASKPSSSGRGQKFDIFFSTSRKKKKIEWKTMSRAPRCDNIWVKRGPWTPEEDRLLSDFIRRHGHGKWREFPRRAGLSRSGKSCRLRWINYLRPEVKQGDFGFEEKTTIINLHGVLGNRWSVIASHLPGRSDNEIKNYWNTRLKNIIRQMGIDPVPREASMQSRLRIRLQSYFSLDYFGYREGGNEVEFRDKIVKEICRKLPTQSRRNHVPSMQGQERMSQEIADLFNTIHPNEKGIRIAGLYGIAGHEKAIHCKIHIIVCLPSSEIRAGRIQGELTLTKIKRPLRDES